MGAQVPGAAFACISKLSDALSVRGDKKYAMRCRKKPRDAPSVRTKPIEPLPERLSPLAIPQGNTPGNR